MLINHVQELLKDRNLSAVQRATGLSYTVVYEWSRGNVKRVDFKTLEIWCKYFSKPVGELLEYRPEVKDG